MSGFGVFAFQLSTCVKRWDERIEDLQTRLHQRRSERKKVALAGELETFLLSLPVPSSLSTCLPQDLQRFLASKDLSNSGKTQVHEVDCEFVGKVGRQSCSCPFRLSACYVQNLVSDMKMIFLRAGRGETWDVNRGIGNPAYAPELQEYILAVKDEQAEAHIAKKQATPMALSKIKRLSKFLSRELSSKDLSVREKFLILRDRAFFLLQFYTASRGGDLTKLLLQEIRRLDDDSGLVIRETYGKMRAEHFVTVKKCAVSEVCPVFALQEYLNGARSMGINIDDGYVFRNTNSKGHVLDSHLSQPSVNKRLALYLNMLGIFEGETTHSLRGGCAVVLKNCHKLDQESSEYVGWKNLGTWHHYSRSKTIDSQNASSTISRCLDGTINSPPIKCLEKSDFAKLSAFMKTSF